MQPVTEKCRVRVGSWKYTMTLFFRPPFSFLSVRYIPSYGGRFELCLVSLFPLDSAEVLYISGSGWKGARSDLLRYLKRAARGGVGRVRKTNSFSRIIPPSLSLSIRVGQGPSTSERPPFDTTAATTSTVLKVVQKLGDASTSRKSPETFLVRQESELPASRH